MFTRFYKLNLVLHSWSADHCINFYFFLHWIPIQEGSGDLGAWNSKILIKSGLKTKWGLVAMVVEGWSWFWSSFLALEFSDSLIYSGLENKEREIGTCWFCDNFPQPAKWITTSTEKSESRNIYCCNSLNSVICTIYIPVIP